jgi:hypothetical protein
MTDRKENLLKRLAEEGQKTYTFFSGLNDGQLSQQVYVDGPQWSVRDILAHLALAESLFSHYNRDVLNGGPGAPEDFNINGFNAEHTLEGRAATVAESLAKFQAARAATVALVEQMQDSDFERHAYHPYLGHTTLDQILKILYRHTMLHERDIRKVLESGQPIPSNE